MNVTEEWVQRGLDVIRFLHLIFVLSLVFLLFSVRLLHRLDQWNIPVSTLMCLACAYLVIQQLCCFLGCYFVDISLGSGVHGILITFSDLLESSEVNLR